MEAHPFAMQKIERLIERIIRRVNINLRGQDFDAGPFLEPCVPLKKLSEFYAFYGITGHHPLHFYFSGSNLAGENIFSFPPPLDPFPTREGENRGEGATLAPLRAFSTPKALSIVSVDNLST
jgi:hypothetical protein